MVLTFATLALALGVFFMIYNARSESRELDRVIALEEKAENLRRRNAYDSSMRDAYCRQRNLVLIEIAQRRRELAAGHNLHPREVNRMLLARRRAR